MLRQIIAFSLLILSGLSAISGEPVNRSSRFKELTNDCVSDGNNSSTCETHNGINSVVIANNDSVVSEKDGDEFLSLLKNTLVEEARGKKKKGYGRIFIILAGVSKAILLYVMLHVVAAVAGKALVVAKVALVIATAVALKKALDHPEKTSYEIVKHPQHSYVQTHSTSVDYEHHGGHEESGGYRRRRKRRA